ncbi:putative RNA-directed DNA polymerase, eukaryota, reverse transcriptase zinc-binding domain protein, partial [Tanacetum coccineum]
VMVVVEAPGHQKLGIYSKIKRIVMITSIQANSLVVFSLKGSITSSGFPIISSTSSGQVYGAGGRPLEYQYKWSQYVQSGVKTEAYEKAPLKAFTGPREEEWAVECNELNVDGLFFKTVPMSIAANMVRNVTNEEIKSVMFDIEDEKAPGPDGFTSVFFKKRWSVVGDDICNAVRDLFSNGLILKEINNTFLALIPKFPTPLRVNDYRPISWIKEVVSENQSAFILGRRISDNILITQELMYSYHKKKGPPRCAFKIDIQKAYDTVDWRFLENILTRFGFHPTMVKWIMVVLHLHLFLLVSMATFMDTLKGKGVYDKEIRFLLICSRWYHQHCKEIQPINVCFADDLFIFARRDVRSAQVTMDALEEFKLTSGLVPSLPKSTVYFCNVSNHTKNAILNIMTFSEGELPVKYLGVPFISSRLLNKDCKILVEKQRIGLETGKTSLYPL